MKGTTKIGKIGKYLFLFIGTVIAAAGLEFFLIPNEIIDGGVVGISIIASYLSKIPLGIFTFVLNIPFLIFGYKQIGKTFAITTFFSIASFSFWVSVFHPIPRPYQRYTSGLCLRRDHPGSGRRAHHTLWGLFGRNGNRCDRADQTHHVFCRANRHVFQYIHIEQRRAGFRMGQSHVLAPCLLHRF